MEKLKVAFVPSYFEFPNFATALDTTIFDVSYTDITNEEQFDIVFAYARRDELPFLRNQKHALIIGFQFNDLWNSADSYHVDVLIDLLSFFDVVSCWSPFWLETMKFLNKEEWRQAYLFSDELDLMRKFSIERRQLDLHTIRAITGLDSRMFLFAALNKDFRLHITSNVEYVSRHCDKFFRTHPYYSYEEYIDYLSTKCKMMFQYCSILSWGRGVIDAVIAGLPSVASGFAFQRLFYPELVCNSMEEATKLLRLDYEEFEPLVEKAQQIYKKNLLSSASTVEQYNQYILN